MIVYQNFEWDFREAAENFDTYGVPFREAATVFTAEDVTITEDVASHQLFARGSSWRGRVLVVQHTRGVRIRILRAMVQVVATEAANRGASRIADLETSAVEPPVPRDIEEPEPIEQEASAGVPVAEPVAAELTVLPTPEIVDVITGAKAGETAELAAPEPQVRRDDSGPFVPDATNLAKTNEDDVVKTITEVVEAKEIAAPEPPARPRRRIIPFRPRSEDTSLQVPESTDVTTAKTANVDAIVETKEISTAGAALPARRRGRPRRVPRPNAAAPLPGVVDRSQIVKTVAEPAPEPEVTPTPKPVVEPPRHRGQPRDTTQLVLELTKPERNEPAVTTQGALSGSRLPGAGMTAEEYGVYWDAYVAARDEAKRQGKGLREAQRIGREAGERAVAQKPAAPAPEPVAAAKAPKKKVSSWRAAAREVK